MEKVIKVKVVQINSLCTSGSTGKICQGISEALIDNNIENYVIYSWGESEYSNAIKCIEKYPKIQILLSRIKGNYGFNSKLTTKKIIDAINDIQPEIVHLHNLHSHNCHLKLLLSYLYEKKIKIVWTFHDCWAFTAYCPHYVMEKCNKWQIECNDCPQFRKFCWFRDHSRRIFQIKKELFANMPITIVTPSKWLSNEVRKSFFKNHRIEVIHNGVNLSIFKPVDSDIRAKFNIHKDKFIILGVAIQWVPRKGADIFVELYHRLDSNKFQIILVGTDKETEKYLPNNIICLRKTNNQEELAEIYSAADLFVNPTREEVFGLVNVEANACGLPVVTFNTGGSPECINQLSGSIVPCDDIDALESEIKRIAKERPFKKEDCVKRAQEFDERKKYLEYVNLYKNLILEDNDNVAK